MTWFKEFINDYGMTIIYAVLTAIAGFVGTKLKSIYENICNDDTKKKYAEIVVKAVEQLYGNGILVGAEKFEKAYCNLSEMLENKGISVSEIEIQMLIEAAVLELKTNWKEGSADGNSAESEE